MRPGGGGEAVLKGALNGAWLLAPADGRWACPAVYDPAPGIVGRVAADPSYAEVERALLGRWPETRLDPSLDRIRALTDLLGDPQHGYAVVHLTGTNGKTSTSRMIDALLTGPGCAPAATPARTCSR